MLILIKSIFGLIMMIMIANKSLNKRIVVDSNDFTFFFGRVIITACTIGFSIYAAKYIRVVYIGFTGNVTPLFTVLFSVMLLGEKLKTHVKFIFFFAFIGALLISLGIYYKYQQKLKINRNATVPILAYLAVISVPVLSSSGNILMRKMKKTHWMTLNIYTNGFNIFFCLFVIAVNQGYDNFNQYGTFDFWDWLLVALMALTEIA